MRGERPIAVVCAMAWELAHLRRALPGGHDDRAGGVCAYLTSLGEQSLVLAYCGMGMVSAAAGTQATISQYHPRAVLNYGCVGAHRPELLPGDLIVGTRVISSQSLQETPDGHLTYAGMHYLADGQQRRTQAVEADPALLAVVRQVAARTAVQPEPWPLALGWPATVPHRPPQVVFGTITSADRWHRSPQSIAALVERYDSLCEDMEAAAIGLVCQSQGVPFLSLKDVSNNELLRPTLSGAAMLDELGREQVARRAAAFTLAVLEALTGSAG
jgi:adenosylhomocysteine nucleosidase